MVEIFTIASGQSGAANRSVSNDIRLTAPSDVYFGSGAAGVAFYEKSGADLKVTLLDGQEVIIRDFFVIGPAGQYSSLRDGGSGGEVEVTGLIAPEPFVPPEVAAPTDTVEVVENAPAAAPSVDLRDGETVIDVNGGASSEAGAVSDAGSAGGGAGGLFAGIPVDRAIFGAAMFPAAAIAIRGGDKDDSTAPATTRAPTADQVVAEGDVDPEIADMIAAIFEPDDQVADLFEADPAPASLGLLADADGAGEFVGVAMDQISALFADLVYISSEG